MGYSESEVNPQLGSGLGLGLGLGSGLGLDSVRGSIISHKMKYLPAVYRRWFPLRRTGGSQALGTRLDCNIYRTKAESTKCHAFKNVNITITPLTNCVNWPMALNCFRQIINS